MEGMGRSLISAEVLDSLRVSALCCPTVVMSGDSLAEVKKLDSGCARGSKSAGSKP